MAWAALTVTARSQSFVFDSDGRLSESRLSSTQRVNYAYDSFGNITQSVAIGIQGEADTEGDTLPDAWELVWFNGLTNTAAGDFNQDTISNLKHYQDQTDPTDPDTDGDGMWNTDELLAGTQPTNAASVFQVSSLRFQASNSVISWSSVAGKKYRLQRSSGLLTTNFSNLKTNITATPTINVYTDETATGAGPYHYRISTE